MASPLLYVKAGGRKGEMKVNSKTLKITVILGLFNLIPSYSWATVAYAQAFVEKYPTTPYALKNCNRCEICHTDRNNAGANNVGLYGNAWFSAWGQLEPVAANQAVDQNAVTAFSNIENLDSDTDGTSNILEINAGMNPGDADRTPAANSCSNISQSLDQNSTFSSGNYSGDFNPNALNSSCGLVKNQGTSISDIDSARILISLLLSFMPILFVAYLRSNNKSYSMLS